jgi:hypothetical protein
MMDAWLGKSNEHLKQYNAGKIEPAMDKPHETPSAKSSNVVKDVNRQILREAINNLGNSEGMAKLLAKTKALAEGADPETILREQATTNSETL